MEKLDLASIDNRQRIINTFVNSIYVYEDRFEVNWNKPSIRTVSVQFEGLFFYFASYTAVFSAFSN